MSRLAAFCAFHEGHASDPGRPNCRQLALVAHVGDIPDLHFAVDGADGDLRTSA
ncbi:MAG TPA: hypothetical protein VFW87_24100 [Pirellulales bacterium]|nr:hypothetical protein [Pirellulales bacterium]